MKKILTLLLFGFVLNSNAQNFYNTVVENNNDDPNVALELSSGKNTVVFTRDYAANKIRKLPNVIDMHNFFQNYYIDSRSEFFYLLNESLKATKGDIIIVPPYRSFAPYGQAQPKSGNIVSEQHKLKDDYKKVAYALNLVLDGLAYYFDNNKNSSGRKITVSSNISIRGLGPKTLNEAIDLLQTHVANGRDVTLAIPEKPRSDADLINESKLSTGNALDKIFEAYEHMGLLGSLTNVLNTLDVGSQATRYDRITYYLSATPEAFHTIPAAAVIVVGDIENFSKLSVEKRVKFLQHRSLGTSLERTLEFIKK